MNFVLLAAGETKSIEDICSCRPIFEGPEETPYMDLVSPVAGER